MSTVKTAISLEKDLFDDVERLAKRLKTPRSRLFAAAVRDLVRKYRARDLKERLDEAYRTPPDADELDMREHMRKLTRRMLAKQPKEHW